MSELKPYPKYKESGLEWLGMIPDEWMLTTIKRIAKVSSSKRIYEGQYQISGIPFYRSKEIVEHSNGEEISANFFINKNVYRKIKSKYGAPIRGDLLITSIGTIGKVWISDGREFYYKDGNITQLRTKENLLVKFIEYCFDSNLFREQYNLMSDGSTLKALTIEKINELIIILPNILHQAKIIEFLDKKTSQVDSLILDKEHLIELLEEKRQAVITETVTKGLDSNVKMKDSGIEWIGEIPEHWDVARLKRYMKVRNGKEVLDENENDNEKEVSVYGSGGIFKKSNHYLYEGASVLFGRKGTIGKPMFVNEKFWTVDTMYYTEFDNNALAEYFYFLLIIYPWEAIATKTALPSIVGTEVENSYIALPKINEQELIVKFLNRKISDIRSLIKIVHKQITKLKEYRESLIYEAVTGKIDLRDYEVENTKV